MISPTSSDYTSFSNFNVSVSEYLKDVFLDLQSRFLNIPAEEFLEPVRLCFHIEEAHWFYTDFHRQEARKQRIELPFYPFPEFVQHFLTSCDIKMSKQEIQNMLTQFNNYKLKIPVCGSIMLNKKMDKVVLIKGFVSSCWSFPRGKIAKNESSIHCAIRETLEETGVDISKLIKQDDFIECHARNSANQKITFYVICGLDEDSLVFSPKARQEIEFVQWHSLDVIMNNGHNSSSSFQNYSAGNYKKSSQNNSSSNSSSNNNYWMIQTQVKQLLKWLEQRQLLNVSQVIDQSRQAVKLVDYPQQQKKGRRRLFDEQQQQFNLVENSSVPTVQQKNNYPSRSKFKPIKSKAAQEEEEADDYSYNKNSQGMSRSLPNNVSSVGNASYNNSNYKSGKNSGNNNNNNNNYYMTREQQHQQFYDNVMMMQQVQQKSGGNIKRRSSMNGNDKKVKNGNKVPPRQQEEEEEESSSPPKNLDVFAFDMDEILKHAV